MSMVRGWRSRWLLLVLGPAGTAMAQGSSRLGGVTGHVYSVETNQPLRFATVTLQTTTTTGRGDGGGGGGSTQTDLTGAFTLTAVQPGTYYVVGRMAGYVSSAPPTAQDQDTSAVLEQTQQPAGLVTVRVEDGQVTPVEVRLERGGAIGGAVRFEDGSPAEGLEVRLYQRVGTTGWQAVTSRGGGSTGRTDDRGRYRIAGLRAGTYAAEVTLPAPAAVQPGMIFRVTGNGRGGAGQSLRVYSGNVFRLKEATGVAVGGTEDRTDLDMQVPLSGLHVLRGDVAAASTGHTVGQGTVELLDPEDGSLLRSTNIASGGAFSIDNVPPGDYILRVEARPDRGPGQTGVHYAALQQPLRVDGDLVTLAYTVQDAQ